MNVPIDRVVERTRLELSAGGARRCEVLPEKRVVDVSTAVELDRGLKRDLLACRVWVIHELAERLLGLRSCSFNKACIVSDGSLQC